jgi:hypothetical protein
MGRRRVGPTSGFVASPEVGPGGHCRYSIDRVLLHISFKPRQEEGRASMYYHMPCSSRPYLPPKWAPTVPRAARLWTPPPCSGGFQCCHMSHGFRPRLSAWEGYGAATCHMISDLTSLLRRAPVLPRIPRLWTLPPCSGGSDAVRVPQSSEDSGS